MKFVARILLGVVCALAVVFALANREVVTVNLWPLPFDKPMPLYIAVLGAVALGLILGAAASWPARERMRRRARAGERRAVALERESAAPGNPPAPVAAPVARPRPGLRAAMDDE